MKPTVFTEILPKGSPDCFYRTTAPWQSARSITANAEQAALGTPAGQKNTYIYLSLRYHNSLLRSILRTKWLEIIPEV
jgi:hypothetical protein